MREWFNNLERREQWALVVGSALLLVYLFYLLVWSPLNSRIENLQQRNTAAADVLVYMQNGVQEIKQLRGGASTTRGGSGGQSLSQMVDQSAAQHGIRISRFQPSGNNEAQVWLENIPFNKLLAWLDQMENSYGVRVKNIAVNNASAVGIVNVRVRFATT